jgi:hypothetical protein
MQILIKTIIYSLLYVCHSLVINREDRETELLLKLEEYELRDHPNARMISHFKKMIGVTRKRAKLAKNRYDLLKKEEYDKFKKSENNKEVEKKTIAIDDSSAIDSDDEEDGDTIGDRNDCNIELHFDGEGTTANIVGKTYMTTEKIAIDTESSITSSDDSN